VADYAKKLQNSLVLLGLEEKEFHPKQPLNIKP
jgi:hypothetical protein